jgi:hypothetical protein
MTPKAGGERGGAGIPAQAMPNPLAILEYGFRGLSTW